MYRMNHHALSLPDPHVLSVHNDAYLHTAAASPSVALCRYGSLSSPNPAKAEDLLYSIRCQECTGRPVYVGPPGDDDLYEMTMACESCGLSPTAETMEEYKKVYAEVWRTLEGEHEVPVDAPEYCIRYQCHEQSRMHCIVRRLRYVCT